MIATQYPCDVAAEQAVLGSLLIDSKSERSQTAINKLTADMFYTVAHATIFNEILKLNSKEIPVDLLTVNDSLEASGNIGKVGGLAYLAELTKNTPAVVNVKAYSNIVKDKYSERQALNMLSECQEIITARSALSTADKISEIQKRFTAIDETARNKNAKGLQDINQVQVQWLEEVRKRYESPDDARGFSTGITALDNKLNPKGIVKGSLVVIGARPKMGKTSLLIKMCLNSALVEKKMTAVFSLEMPSIQLFERMITQISSVNSDVFYDAYKNQDEFGVAMSAVDSIISSGNLYVDDTPAININHIKSECRRLKREKGSIGMIFVDYLTLMDADKAERNDLAYGAITKGLKSLAKELDCVVVLLTQLNRNLESRTDKRPYPSDSRDTGQIEQDCDYWIGLYRDGVYNENADQNLMEVILRLNRHGSTGTVYAEMKHGQIFDTNQAEAREKLNSSKKKKKIIADF